MKQMSPQDRAKMIAAEKNKPHSPVIKQALASDAKATAQKAADKATAMVNPLFNLGSTAVAGAKAVGAALKKRDAAQSAKYGVVGNLLYKKKPIK